MFSKSCQKPPVKHAEIIDFWCIKIPKEFFAHKISWILLCPENLMKIKNKENPKDFRGFENVYIFKLFRRFRKTLFFENLWIFMRLVELFGLDPIIIIKIMNKNTKK